MKQTVDFKKMKENGESVVMLTSYDYPSAKIAEEAGVDMILVGDSLGMVVLGYESTIPVTMADMIHHTKAVKRGARNTFVVTDMPFMSYHASIQDAMINGAKLMQEASADAVKVEGAGEVLTVIERLTQAGVPVVGHLGLTPQSVAVLGGYKVQGKDAADAQKLIQDAKAVEEAGAFALVLECVPRQLAETISAELTIPTIGIGAGPGTDGQVLVYHDLVGYGSHRIPKFVKQYTNVSGQIEDAIRSYVDEVRSHKFPEEKHSFTMKEEQLASLYGGKV
ncbi:3-methyl-2-oxobutanoate hydroxymethyltransferase [Pseudalkalibacillus sp. Hm43]|uniref:3-methyl-2-oxobutanoate hydroxymethyltransferase n=1 Tax=Pseudalkalibacillus sp. Hm43 TaxID=3450742 RepID=UPI003F441587